MKTQRWYADVNTERPLDYTKPIIASHKNYGTSLLMPVTAKECHDSECEAYRPRAYEVIGYNWFSFDEGAWTSAKFWATPQAAIKDGGRTPDYGYVVTNASIEITAIKR